MAPTQHWPRWMAAAGIVFGILLVAGSLLINLPDGTDEQVTSFYADSGNRTGLLIAAYILVAAGIAFLIYLVDLQTRFRAVDSAGGPWGQISRISGIVFVALLIAGAIMLASVAANIAFGDAPNPTASVARFLPEAGWGFLLVGGAIMAAVHITSTAIEALRTRLLPKWLCQLGFVLSVVLLFAIVFFPLIALPLWTIITSVVLLRGQGSPAATSVPVTA